MTSVDTHLVVLDTNVWIEAATASASRADELLVLAIQNGMRIGVSKHSLVELANGSHKYGAGAENLARTHLELPYYPIGKINELLGTTSELAGTLDDMRANEALRMRLGSLARAGTDIRDRGAVIDALKAGATYFVTEDKGLVSAGPRSRIESALPICVRTPAEMLQILMQQ